MRVLVVEDEKKTASFVRKALQAENFAVDMMANGDDALLPPPPTRRSMPSSSTSCCRDATA